MTRVLHLYSNCKWTDPADHALNLVSWLAHTGLYRYILPVAAAALTPASVHFA